MHRVQINSTFRGNSVAVFRRKENRPLDQKAMFQFDVTEKVASIIEKNNFVMIYVSNKLTDQFQPLELEVRS